MPCFRCSDYDGGVGWWWVEGGARPLADLGRGLACEACREVPTSIKQNFVDVLKPRRFALSHIVFIPFWNRFDAPFDVHFLFPRHGTEFCIL